MIQLSRDIPVDDQVTHEVWNTYTGELVTQADIKTGFSFHVECLSEAKSTETYGDPRTIYGIHRGITYGHRLSLCATARPAVEYFYENGTRYLEIWASNNKKHRGNGPSAQIFDENKKLVSEFWHCDGVLHRSDGPAISVLTKRANETVWTYVWMIDGQELPKFHQYGKKRFRDYMKDFPHKVHLLLKILDANNWGDKRFRENIRATLVFI